MDKGQISKLIDHYSKELHGNFTKSTIIKIVNQIIRNFSYNHDSVNNLDLGRIYTEEISYKDRKVLGEIYTPPKIVKYILDAVEFTSEKNLHKKKIIDLSCGSGSFLIHAINRLKNFYKKRFGTKKEEDLSLEEGISIINAISNSIYGIDVNPIACILAQINFHLALSDIYQIIFNLDENYNIPFFKIFNLNAYNLKTLKNYINFQNFDFVVGNPPYLFIRSISDKNKNVIESNDFNTNQGQYDSYQLFLELGIRLLQKGGHLGYIIPDSILALSNRAIIRKYICKYTKIRSISIVGEQFENSIVSNIILTLEKEPNQATRKENIIDINKFNEQSKSKNKIKQRMLKHWNYRFLINLTERDIEILNYLNKRFPKLGELIQKDGFDITLSRGVELTKEGKVFFCKTCNKYFPLPRGKNKCKNCGNEFGQQDIEKIIRNQKPTHIPEAFRPYLYSLQRYRVKKCKYININKPGINYKDLDNYKDRIIIRQLNQDNLICASYHKGQLLSSQSYYNLKVHEASYPLFDNLYLLALLNSHLLSYYFIKSFGSYKQLFKRILIQKIKGLPIKIPKTVKEQEVVKDIRDYIDILLREEDLKPNKYKSIQEELDRLIYKLYKLDKSQQLSITKFFNHIQES